VSKCGKKDSWEEVTLLARWVFREDGIAGRKKLSWPFVGGFSEIRFLKEEAEWIARRGTIGRERKEPSLPTPREKKVLEGTIVREKCRECEKRDAGWEGPKRGGGAKARDGELAIMCVQDLKKTGAGYSLSRKKKNSQDR